MQFTWLMCLRKELKDEQFLWHWGQHTSNDSLKLYTKSNSKLGSRSLLFLVKVIEISFKIVKPGKPVPKFINVMVGIKAFIDFPFFL